MLWAVFAGPWCITLIIAGFVRWRFEFADRPFEHWHFR